MKKSIPAITLIVLIGTQAPVHATWTSEQKEMTSQEEAEVKTPGFNRKDNRSFFIEADYLFWRPQLEDAVFALTNRQTGSGSTTSTVKFNLQQPSYDISSGVRFGIGGYSSDSWDIGLKATYLHADAAKHVQANISQQAEVLPQWIPTVFGVPGSQADAHWQLNFYVLDFAIGREFFLTKRFAIHPFIGLRGYDISQKFRNKYVGSFSQGLQTSPIQVLVPGQFNAHQNIWGVGPRLGIDLNFYLSNSWSFLGGLSGSLLYSDYKVKQKFMGHQSSNTGNGTTFTITSINGKTMDKSVLGRSNLDAYFGLGWDKWFNSGKNRIAISLAFEASYWFQLNQWLNIDLTSLGNNMNGKTDIMSDKRHGDLSFVGGTLHFQIDF